jgi:hypothetical protein
MSNADPKPPRPALPDAPRRRNILAPLAIVVIALCLIGEIVLNVAFHADKSSHFEHESGYDYGYMDGYYDGICEAARISDSRKGEHWADRIDFCNSTHLKPRSAR